MRKFLYIFLFLLSLKSAISQVVFCPPGAEWHYLFSSSAFAGSPAYYNDTIKYVKDSVAGGVNVKLLHHKRSYSFCNITQNFTTMIKQNGDTVFMNGLLTKNTWQILYNYATPAGQSWTTTITAFYDFNAINTYTVVVDSVDYVTINNLSLKRLIVRYLSSNNIFASVPALQITERFGCSYFLLHYRNPGPGVVWHCDGPNKFLCYQDSAFGLKQFSSFPCDFENPVALVENKYVAASILVWPNPFNEFITIKSEDESLIDESHLTISDFSGRIVKYEKIAKLQQSLDLKDLSSGIYILTINKGKELLSKGKVVKE